MKNSLGYLLGFLVFVAGIPALMYWASGRPLNWIPAMGWAVTAVILMLLWLLSILAVPVFVVKDFGLRALQLIQHRFAAFDKVTVSLFKIAGVPGVGDVA